jgi:hypothetical protein
VDRAAIQSEAQAVAKSVLQGLAVQAKKGNAQAARLIFELAGYFPKRRPGRPPKAEQTDYIEELDPKEQKDLGDEFDEIMGDADGDSSG